LGSACTSESFETGWSRDKVSAHLNTTTEKVKGGSGEKKHLPGGGGRTDESYAPKRTGAPILAIDRLPLKCRRERRRNGKKESQC